MIPKINLSKATRWDHHRSGWAFCLDSLNVLHNPYGVILVGSVEEATKKETLPDTPWLGFVHNTPHHPEIMKCLYGELHGEFDLEKLFSVPYFRKSLDKCCGLFCLSENTCRFVKSRTNVLCEKLYHATEIPEIVFNWEKFLANENKKLIMVGHWMRNWQAIFDLPKVDFQKCILKGGAFNYEKIGICCRTNDSVTYLSRLSDEEYDDCLSQNLVFLNLFDGGANNAIIECMARQTPIVVNRLSSAEEYLGVDYPLLYDSLEDIPPLLSEDNIKRAHEHLSTVMFKITGELFLESFVDSKIYSSIPYISF